MAQQYWLRHNRELMRLVLGPSINVIMHETVYGTGGADAMLEPRHKPTATQESVLTSNVSLNGNIHEYLPL